MFCSALLQAGPISVKDITDHPESFIQDQKIELRCHFLKESNSWLHLLSDSSRYTGLFVFERKDSLIIKEKITFPYVFAQRQLQGKIRNLRSGDFILITGTCFKHQAVGKEAVGIVADQILVLGEDGTPETVDSEKTGEWSGRFNPPKKARSLDPSGSALAADPDSQGTYTIRLGNDSLSGLHWGERYTMNGMEFVVTKDDK